jgi:hypothetical protein
VYRNVIIILCLGLLAGPAGADELSADRITYVENFAQGKPGLNEGLDASLAMQARTNPHFQLEGVNASSDRVAKVNAGISFWTSDPNDQMILRPHTDASVTSWNTGWAPGGQVVWEAVIKPNGTIAAMKVWAGLKVSTTPVIATDDDQIFFYFDGGADSTWHVVDSKDGAHNDTDTDVLVSTSAPVHLKIETFQDGGSWKATF